MLEDAADDPIRDLKSECRPGEYECVARVLRRMRGAFVDLERVNITYSREVEAAMDAGPCREVLSSPSLSAELGRIIREFDSGLAELERGNAEPIREALHSPDAAIGDPRPCRPR